MSAPAELSLTTAVTLILGGIAAFILALVLALGGYGRPRTPRAPAVPPQPAPSASVAAPAEVIEVPVDTSESDPAGAR